MGFTPRLTAPSANDPHWISALNGGLNECLRIDAVTGSVLPNCVGYAWGRFYELTGDRPDLSTANADAWFGYTADGYERGQDPRLGAVACWSGGGLSGHVAIVEEVQSDGTITTSNSDYSGTRWYLQIRLPGYHMAGYTFQGFIYAPHYLPGGGLPAWLLGKIRKDKRRLK